MLSSTCDKGRSLFGLGNKIVCQPNKDGLIESLLFPEGKRFSIKDKKEGGYVPKDFKEIYAAYVIGSRAIGIESLNKTEDKKAGTAFSNAILQSQEYIYQLFVKSGVLNAENSDLSPIDEFNVTIDGDLPEIFINLTDKKGENISFCGVENKMENIIGRLVITHLAFGFDVIDTANVSKNYVLTNYHVSQCGTAAGLNRARLFNFPVEGSALERYYSTKEEKLDNYKKEEGTGNSSFNTLLCSIMLEAVGTSRVYDAFSYLSKTDAAMSIGIVDDCQFIMRLAEKGNTEELNDEILNCNINAIRKIAQIDLQVFLNFISLCKVGDSKFSIVFCPSFDYEDGVAWRVVYVTR